jgi:2-oxo-3-hexenedioate decarboxylase
MPAQLDAATLLAAYDRAADIDRSRPAPPDLDAAYRLQAQVVALRQARGERVVGMKIGFTNRTIWPIYGVEHPIWAPVYDSTTRLLDAPAGDVGLARFVRPRIEPEIVLGLAGHPASDGVGDVLGCIEWIAHGFEIVQCPYPDWRLDPVEAVLAQGLHGALLVGPRRRIDHAALPATLAAFSLTLECDGTAVAEGRGEFVLGSPLLALCHLVRGLNRQGTTLPAGALVTTGTITDAQPLAPGQTWRTRLHGLDLPGMSLATR